ncbi:hypothetical protein J7K50_07630 [bacterium]|nr:hypothetical protein [bacterium]
MRRRIGFGIAVFAAIIVFIWIAAFLAFQTENAALSRISDELVSELIEVAAMSKDEARRKADIQTPFNPAINAIRPLGISELVDNADYFRGRTIRLKIRIEGNAMTQIDLGDAGRFYAARVGEGAAVLIPEEMKPEAETKINAVVTALKSDMSRIPAPLGPADERGLLLIYVHEIVDAEGGETDAKSESADHADTD